MKIRVSTDVNCPFCAGKYFYSEKARHGVGHSLPMCVEFKTLEPMKFLKLALAASAGRQRR